MIDLVGLEPIRISRDLKGKYMLLYSLPKAGKTSLASKFPKSLILGFEKGYNGLAGVMAIDVPKWSKMKEALRELKKPEVQAKFDTIIVDTATIAWELAEEYICIQNDVTEISEIPWGRGYKLTAKEFNSTMRQITMLGYGLVFISHSEEKPIADGEEGETFVAPALEKRAYKIINGMVDIIAYIKVDLETGGRTLVTRANKHVVAGSRFRFLPEEIELSYEKLVEALADAIEKEGAAAGGMIIDDRLDFKTVNRSFAATMEEAKNLWKSILEKAGDPEAKALEMKSIIKEHFGSDIKLSETTEAQQDLVELVIFDLKELN